MLQGRGEDPKNSLSIDAVPPTAVIAERAFSAVMTITISKSACLRVTFKSLLNSSRGSKKIRLTIINVATINPNIKPKGLQALLVGLILILTPCRPLTTGLGKIIIVSQKWLLL